MIIVSQDKREIINFDNVLNIVITTEDEGCVSINAGMKAPDDNFITLGFFKTDKKALEVLQNICRQVYIQGRVYEIPK